MTTGMEKSAAGEVQAGQPFRQFQQPARTLGAVSECGGHSRLQRSPQMLEAQPRLVDRKGNAKRIIEQAPTYPSLRQYMDHLEVRAGKMSELTHARTIC